LGNELLKKLLVWAPSSTSDAARKNITGVKMALRKVIAIIRTDALDEIEKLKGKSH